MTLAKNWTRYNRDHGQWLLTAATGTASVPNWAWIRPAVGIKGWELLVWEKRGSEAWGFETHAVLPTLRAAKSIGRMRAAASMQNF